MSEERTPITVQLPRITRAMKILSIYSVGIWLAGVILLSVMPAARNAIMAVSLIASRVVPGLELWRAFTYVLVENPTTGGAIWHVLAFWLIGSPIEERAGLRRIVGLGVAGTVGGAVAVILASRIAISVYNEPVLGMEPLTGALLVGWGFQYANQRVSFFGMGSMTGKQLSFALGTISALLAILSRSGAGFASIGGLLGGFAYMLVASRGDGQEGRFDGRDGGPRKRRPSGERFKVIQGGRDDRHMWN